MNKQDIEKAWQRVCMWIGCTPKENTDAHEVYKIIKKTLEQQLTNGWIPVSERLPEESGHYLVTDALNKLSAYKDTGLTPEEIKGLINTNKNLVKQNDKQYKELQKAIKDRDYWKAEALKHCAKLGEIKLLIRRQNE